MVQGSLKIHTENILPIIKKWLYSEKDIFVRELVSNASDALDKLKYLTVADDAYKAVAFNARIDISFDKEAKTLTIADTGVGIPKGEIPRLGERFYRADKARSRQVGGTGLGLSIVKHLMRAHQGRISIDSTLGHGTTVSLHFPMDTVVMK